MRKFCYAGKSEVTDFSHLTSGFFMNTQRIRLLKQVSEMDHLKDCISNGFIFRENKVKVPTQISEVIEQTVRLSQAFRLEHHYIDHLRGLCEERMSKYEFDELLKDHNFSFFLNTMHKSEFPIPMSCFTESTDGIRNHNSNLMIFGRYGICMQLDWAISHGADRVIYIASGREISKRLGSILAFLRMFSYLNTGPNTKLEPYKTVEDSLLDFLSFTEIGDNLDELEWRIVQKHRVFGGKPDEKERIGFEIKDIDSIYVPSDTDKTQIEVLLNQKRDAENYKGILPEIKNTDELYEF